MLPAGWASYVSAWGVSAALHASLALVLAVIAVVQPALPPVWRLKSQFTELASVAAPFDPPILIGGTPSESPAPALQGPAGPLTPQSVAEPSDEPQLRNVAPPALKAATGGQKQASSGKQEKSGTPDVNPGTVEFFGTKQAANRVVFVVDLSGSMQGARFAHAKRELMKTLVKLHHEQEFYIFFYNLHTFPMHHPRPVAGLQPATKANLLRAQSWIRTRIPAGGTFPDEALASALTMQPDVVFFLTDGEIPPTAPATVAAANPQRKTVVHTIALKSKSGEAMMKVIAQQNGGTYLYVR